MKQLSSPGGGALGDSAPPSAKRPSGPHCVVHMRRPSGLVPAIKLFTVFGYEKDRDCPQVGAPDEALEEAGGSWAFPSHFFRKVEES